MSSHTGHAVVIPAKDKLPNVNGMTVPFLTRWATASQHRARRNAMLAATVLAQRRVERMEVEEFLASLGDPVTPHSAQQSDEPVSAHG